MDIWYCYLRAEWSYLREGECHVTSLGVIRTPESYAERIGHGMPMATDANGSRCQWQRMPMAVDANGSGCQWQRMPMAMDANGSGCQWQWMPTASRVGQNSGDFEHVFKDSIAPVEKKLFSNRKIRHYFTLGSEDKFLRSLHPLCQKQTTVTRTVREVTTSDHVTLKTTPRTGP